MRVEPSTPSHTPTSNGILIDVPHVSFWVENATRPACAATEGRAKPKPKQSGRKTSREVTPNSRRKKPLP
jgi:hypothetical protein